MRETWKNGTKVKFVDQKKYDNREHTILNVQDTPNDVCYFLHYWSWIDEDELELTEDSSIKFKPGNIVGYKDKEAWGNDVNTIKEYKDTAVHYEEGGFDSEEDLELEKPVKEDAVVSPSHYTTTKISALDVVNDWELDFYLGNVIKYIKRHELKGNAVQDLKKAAQYLQLKIELLEKE